MKRAAVPKLARVATLLCLHMYNMGKNSTIATENDPGLLLIRGGAGAGAGRGARGKGQGARAESMSAASAALVEAGVRLSAEQVKTWSSKRYLQYFFLRRTQHVSRGKGQRAGGKGQEHSR